MRDVCASLWCSQPAAGRSHTHITACMACCRLWTAISRILHVSAFRSFPCCRASHLPRRATSRSWSFINTRTPSTPLTPTPPLVSIRCAVWHRSNVNHQANRFSAPRVSDWDGGLWGARRGCEAPPECTARGYRVRVGCWSGGCAFATPTWYEASRRGSGGGGATGASDAGVGGSLQCGPAGGGATSPSRRPGRGLILAG